MKSNPEGLDEWIKKIKLSQIKNKSEFCWETKSTQNPQIPNTIKYT